MDEKYGRAYLVRFSSTVWRGQFALKFFAKIFEKKIYDMFTTCQFKIIYMSTTVPSSSWLVKH